MMKKTLLGLAFFCSLSVSVAEPPGDDDFACDHYPDCVLQVRAWDALGAGELEVAASFASACATIVEEEGRKQQASLPAKPTDDQFMDYGALNSAGTCYFIKGEALMKLDNKDEALAAYKTVVDEFSYAKAWDPRGWFWTVADAAAEKINKLERD